MYLKVQKKTSPELHKPQTHLECLKGESHIPVLRQIHVVKEQVHNVIVEHVTQKLCVLHVSNNDENSEKIILIGAI